MGCGDFAKGFARVRCDECSHEYLLAFSCKGRWFCPSCHQKKVQIFGAMLAESILAAVPHRHFTFTIPKMLRPYFRFHRGLLKQLCLIAHQCVRDFLQDAFGDVSLPHFRGQVDYTASWQDCHRSSNVIGLTYPLVEWLR